MILLKEVNYIFINNMNFNCINKYNCNKKSIKLHVQTKYTCGHFLSIAYILQNFEENYK